MPVAPPTEQACLKRVGPPLVPRPTRNQRHRVGLEEAVTTSRQAPQLHHSTLQESLPRTSAHALHRQHKARPAGARADLTCLRALRRSMEPSRKGSWLRPTGRSRLIDGLQVSC